MTEWLTQLTEFNVIWGKYLVILVTYLLALIFIRFSGSIARRFIKLNRFAGRSRKLIEQRQETLHGLLTGIISFLAIFIATMASLSLFVDADTIVWMVVYLALPSVWVPDLW